MEIYQTEEQQVEAIKSFWSENGNSIIAGLVIGFAGFIGFNYYQDHQLAKQQQVADSYMTLVEDAGKNPTQFMQKAESFINKNGGSSYASLTALTLAKTAIDKKEFTQATKSLQTAIDKAPNDAIKSLATLRLAHLQIQLKAFDKALATLAKPMPKAFIASVAEAKGDVYVLQGKNDLARNAYQTAIDNDGLKTSPNLQLKIDDLAIALN
ncbi:MAG: hypothetical protein COB35_05350 [Gammaproteobacteria bacterium]|nr:MAG: hypothetical protein COB35_05350 [Gammaproteobacteria bacterium]